jgi:hypothetical protein
VIASIWPGALSTSWLEVGRERLGQQTSARPDRTRRDAVDE